MTSDSDPLQPDLHPNLLPMALLARCLPASTFHASWLAASLLGAGPLLSVAPSQALPVLPAIQNPVGAVQGGDPSFSGSLGYGFTLTAPLSLTALGFHDADEDGLLSPHAVGLFDANTQGLLASATVPAGTLAPLVGGFRWVPIPDLQLLPGSYVIAATTPGDPALFDPFLFGATQVSALEAVLMGTASLSEIGSGTAVVFPTVDEGQTYGFIGPSFGVSSVPAPLPLFGAASAFAWSRRLRRRIGRPASAAAVTLRRP